ncbi:DUF7386 family protein [Natronoglomus mannanivorans]|uniref:Uncharacterized protein n=1 Tax=Natronoglomus mannanivorans TaxID=2979990 RepID=A0AAP3E4M1_9EURY|nr:hypothetical protein [Halobacteria archaeon AArc-xg1-1]
MSDNLLEEVERERRRELETEARKTIEHEQNLDDARDERPPETIQQFNTSVIGLRYRTSLESRYR